jgi:nitrite reductase/ring-hydroxylating ferredoxin subunit
MESGLQHGPDESVSSAWPDAAGRGRDRGLPLCRLEEIADPGSRAFELEDRSIFVVRRGAQFAAYVNSCPHTRGPLDWIEGQFLDLSGEHIVCATHGAMFRIADGHCIAGPCVGDRLAPARVVLIEGVLRLLD